MRVTATLMAAAIFAAPAFAEKSQGPVFEPDTYRFGGTYTVVSSQSPSQCSTACGRDTNCKSWSFVDLPGASAQNACELKSTIGRSEANPSATSGLSPQVERSYQPSPYNSRTLANGRSFSAPTSRRLYGGAQPSPSASIPTSPQKNYAAPLRTTTTTTTTTTKSASRAPVRRSAPAFHRQPRQQSSRLRRQLRFHPPLHRQQ